MNVKKKTNPWNRVYDFSRSHGLTNPLRHHESFSFFYESKKQYSRMLREEDETRLSALGRQARENIKSAIERLEVHNPKKTFFSRKESCNYADLARYWKYQALIDIKLGEGASAVCSIIRALEFKFKAIIKNNSATLTNSDTLFSRLKEIFLECVKLCSIYTEQERIHNALLAMVGKIKDFTDQDAPPKIINYIRDIASVFLNANDLKLFDSESVENIDKKEEESVDLKMEEEPQHDRAALLPKAQC